MWIILSKWFTIFQMFVTYDFHTTSLVSSPIASRVCFSLGALITPTGSAFSFSSATPLPTRCHVPLGSAHVPQVTILVWFSGSCMWHGQGDVLVSVFASENIFRQHGFTNMISASAYTFWLSHIVFIMCFCLLVFRISFQLRFFIMWASFFLANSSN